MKNYTVISKDIIEYKSNNKLLDIYTLACIKSTIDYKSGISKLNQKTMSERFDIPERTLKNIIARLENGKLLSVQRRLYENKNPKIISKSIQKNYYKFDINPENYFFIYNHFLKMNIANEIKGFMLLLKAICFNNTNDYTPSRSIMNGINKSELSKLICMNKKTVEKYLNIAIELNQIAIVDNHIIVKSNYFPIRINESKNKFENRKTEIMNTILNICNKHNAIMPLVSKEDMNRVILHYPLLEDDIREVNDINFIKMNSLEYRLNKRIKSLPTQFNMEYIFNILNVPSLDKKEEMKYELKL